LVWIKNRTFSTNHGLVDTVRGRSKVLFSNATTAEQTSAVGDDVTSFLSNGFSLGGSGTFNCNSSDSNYASWTWRKQSKFFDIQTWTGSGANRTISHALGSVPACIIVKRTDTTGDWQVYHRSLANTEYLVLNSTAAKATGATRWNSTTPTSSVFSLGTDASVNASAGTYIAYIFAHDAGGFGLTGTDNVISCGSYSHTNGSNTSVTLGFEPQFCINRFTGVGIWVLMDSARGMPALGGGNGRQLQPQSSDAEEASGTIKPTATGFIVDSSLATGTYIYIAIRRGPMKVPTTGTSVFSPNSQTASTGTAITTNFPPDLQLYRSTSQVGNEGVVVDRLRGVNTTTTANSTPWLDTTTTAAEASASSVTRNWGNTGFQMPAFVATVPSVFYSLRRAPSFMDVVCYTGDGTSNRQLNHNLTVTPELIIAKRRSASQDWVVFGSAVGSNKYLILNTTAASDSATIYTSTSTTFGAQASLSYNTNAVTYVAYLFATCAGVSKVFSYTGNGSSQTINCGFTGGARFVMIKRTDSAGDWYVWDTARGIVSGNDPHLSLNTTAAEVTTDDTIDTDSTGFVVNQVAATNVNVSSATYIGLAVA
jgi:hypothetical protein